MYKIKPILVNGLEMFCLLQFPLQYIILSVGFILVIWESSQLVKQG